MSRVAENLLNKKSQTANKVWSCSLVIGYFYCEGFLTPHPTPKLEEHLLLAVSDCGGLLPRHRITYRNMLTK
jgi:hypothetical protein